MKRFCPWVRMLPLIYLTPRFVEWTTDDATFSALESSCGIEVILVGDSLGMILQGHDSTLPVTMEDILYHLDKAGLRCLGKAHAYEGWGECLCVHLTPGAHQVVTLPPEVSSFRYFCWDKISNQGCILYHLPL